MIQFKVSWMVNAALLNELKTNVAAGSNNTGVGASLQVMEFFKQIAQEDIEMKQELGALNLLVAINVTDKNKKYWMKVAEGKIEYGEGEVKDPTFIFSAAFAVLFDVIIGKLNATSEYLAGNVGIEGNVPDAMAFQSIIQLAMEKYETLVK